MPLITLRSGEASPSDITLQVQDADAVSSAVDITLWPGEPITSNIVVHTTMADFFYAAVAWVQIEIPKAPPLTPRRALYLAAGVLGQIPTGLLGTGLKPVVILSGELKERAASEGTPVILDAGLLRCLNAASESLEV